MHRNKSEQLTFTFVTDVESAVAEAKAAVRDKAVQVVGGVSVSVAQQLLDTESASLERVRLEKISVHENKP